MNQETAMEVHFSKTALHRFSRAAKETRVLLVYQVEKVQRVTEA